MKKIVFCAMIALVLAVSVSISAGAEYIHGYFRYTVDDGSVTITAYRGNEEEVTVPSMIGGNPVNVIASGAFANNPTVKIIRLPDTIMTVEPGAFGEGQRVIYAFDLIGDVDGDGELNNKDVVLLFRYVSHESPEYAAEYDVNSDGSINNRDVVALFRALSK